MWANFAHGLLMAAQATTEIHHYWSKFLTDIPFVLILALGIYLWRRRAIPQQRAQTITDVGAPE
jgi:hypothetical protein